MSLTSDRAHVAALSRHRAPDDPELIAARAKLREDALVNAIERTLKKAPPLTDQVRDRIVGLLSAPPVEPETKSFPSLQDRLELKDRLDRLRHAL